MAEKIKKVNMLQQYKDDIIIYGAEVNIRRAIPAVDGLKLVHRRILYAMFNDLHLDKGKTAKSMGIVGQTMTLYHVHGDSSIYDAMKPMTNWFESYIPLIDKQGSFGTIQGSPAAAARYTEAKLSQFAIEAVIGELAIDKNVIDWLPNFDNTTVEPELLPVAVPLILINGASGIGVGTTCDVPSHNINEVIDATINYILNPNDPIVLIPDQCQRCNIIETDFTSIANLGNGKFTVMGIIDIEQIKHKTCLVIKSTPDLVYLNSIIEAIEKLIIDKKIMGIQDMYDESTIAKNPGEHDILRYVIVLKQGTDPNYVKEMIYKHTNMKKTQKVNFELIDGVTPIRFSHKSYIEFFVEQRRLTKFRSYCLRLKRAKTKYHEVEAYIKLLESGEIEKVINMIRKQKSTNNVELMEYLIKKIGVTDIQAKFILNANIKNLSYGYLSKYKEQYSSLKKEIDLYNNMITKDELIMKEIMDELLYFKKKYGKPRNCNIISESSISDVPAGDFKIIITYNNYIKKVSINDNIGSFKGDQPKHIMQIDNRENILLFDEHGRVFSLPVSKIPLADRSSNGIDIRMLLKNCTSNIINIMPLPILKHISELNTNWYITIVTYMGTIKKIDVRDVLSAPPSGILYIKLKDGDYVKGLICSPDKNDIIIYSKNKALRMPQEDVPELKRNAIGVKGMNSDEIDGICSILPQMTHILVITETGKANLFDVSGMQRSNRGRAGKGVIKGKDSIYGIYGVSLDKSINIITNNNKIVIPVKDIPVGSSISPGVKILNKTDTILKVEIL